MSYEIRKQYSQSITSECDVKMLHFTLEIFRKGPLLAVSSQSE